MRCTAGDANNYNIGKVLFICFFKLGINSSGIV